MADSNNSSNGYIETKPLMTTELKQTQRLIMSPQMQQAIQLLQVPAMELASLIELEMELNPLLEYTPETENEEEPEEDRVMSEEAKNEEEGAEPTQTEPEMIFNEDDFSFVQELEDEFGDHWEQSSTPYGFSKKDSERLHSFLENSITSEETLYEHLIHQAHETFNKEDEIALAEALIGNIDSSGYLKTSIEELSAICRCTEDDIKKILDVLHTFDPPGVGARSLQEALLIQLQQKNKTQSLAYKIVKDCYHEMLHNQIPTVAKQLKCSNDDVSSTITHEIAPLDLHPGLSFGRPITQPIVPDASIQQEGDKLTVYINEDQLPAIRMNRTYLKLLNEENLDKETKEFIQRKIKSAKWLLKNIIQRNDTIERIVRALAEKQRAFFISPTGALMPLTMRMIADELEVHESTVARAVAHKYIDTPKGLLPLRFFFTNAYTSSKGTDVSSDTVRHLLEEAINKEDKSSPYSDNRLSQILQKHGIHCARRTIAKYRQELSIGNALQRKKY